MKLTDRRAQVTMLMIALIILAVPLYLIPNAWGASFLAAKLQVVNLTTNVNYRLPGNTTFAVRVGNETVNVTGIAFSIHLSDSYFLPVIATYRGDDLVICITSQPVSKPCDGVSGTTLVWRITNSAYLDDGDNIRFPNTGELLQHTASVPTQGMDFIFGDQATTWNGTDARTGSFAAPGTYYVYGLALGIQATVGIIKVVQPK